MKVQDPERTDFFCCTYGCTFNRSNSSKQGIPYIGRGFDVSFTKPKYFFDKTIYENRVFDSHGVADPSVEIQFGPNIKDWPAMSALPENMLLKVVSEIHDPVTTTDELIPSGETSSYRSNPLGLAEFALSRKDPVCRPCKGNPESPEGYREW